MGWYGRRFDRLWRGTLTAKLEHLSIMDGFRFGSAFSNQQLSVYVAYWVESSGELVYMREPFTLVIQ